MNLLISPIVYFAPAAWKLFLAEQWCFVEIFHPVAELISRFALDTEQPTVPVSHLAHGRTAVGELLAPPTLQPEQPLIPPVSFGTLSP